tara:strand:- start:2770 stop:3042 length:273 start_codon:yes stop_codon:yes gene_type:complete
MSNAGAQNVMQSALEQWDVVDRITEAAQAVLSEEECLVLSGMASKRACRAFTYLDRATPTGGPHRREGTRLSNSTVKELRHELEKRAKEA